MKHFLAVAGLIAVCSFGASARSADAESDAWAAALALKQKSQRLEGAAAVEAFVQTASAFEAFAETHAGSTHAQEALVEAGVSWFAVGRNRQTLHRSPPASVEAFQTALTLFAKLLTEHPSDPSTGRAQYMRGSTQLFLGDLEAAEKEYTLAIDNYGSDPKYFSKSLERRAAVRRHRLKIDLAVADMRRYQRDAAKGSEDANVIVRQLEYSALIGKPAAALDVETWIQGEPVELAGLQGEVVALYFFASWCPNCSREREFLNDMYQRYSASGLRVIGVTDHSESQTVLSVQGKLAQEPLSFPVLMDGGGTMRSFLVGKFPDMVLIDRAGRVRWHDNPAALADWTVEALLFEGADAPGGAKPK